MKNMKSLLNVITTLTRLRGNNYLCTLILLTLTLNCKTAFMQNNEKLEINQFRNKTFIYSVSSDSNNFKKIKKIEMSVLNGLVNQNQYTVRYRYFGVNDIFLSEEITGLLLNSEKIWLHPPRSIAFEELEFTPFPYIRFNKKTWGQQIKVGKEWLNDKKQDIELTNSYKIDKEQTVKSLFGEIKCYRVVSSAKSKQLGSSQLIMLFNKKYGFIELNYILLDKSKLTLKLTDIIEN